MCTWAEVASISAFSLVKVEGGRSSNLLRAKGWRNGSRPLNQEIVGSNPTSPAKKSTSGPETWVTERT